MSLRFEGLKIYFSGSIKGTPEPDPEFAWKLVQHMGRNGANVLSEHVAARTKVEMDEILARNVGQTIAEIQNRPEPWWEIRRQDMAWVDEATHMVALVNAPSFGVGMEIQRAISKPQLGLNETPILALVSNEILPRLSFMIRGISKIETLRFSLQTYGNLDEAIAHIDDFLKVR